LTALRMGEEGFKVYAGVLNEAEGKQLVSDFQKGHQTGGSLTPLILDITKQQDIDAAFDLLQSELKDGLQLLLNNAGIAPSAILEIQPFDDFKRVIEVNLLGHVRMTKKFLPLLRKSALARIVNLTSIAGKVAGPLTAAYCSSKFAMEAVNDALRRELRHLGISVSAIEPGFTNTTLLTASKDYTSAIMAKTSPELRQVYAPLIRDQDKVWAKVLPHAQKPERVVDDAIYPALTERHPLTRYVVGSDAKFFNFTNWILPDRVLDLIYAFMIEYGFEDCK